MNRRHCQMSSRACIINCIITILTFLIRVTCELYGNGDIVELLTDTYEEHVWVNHKISTYILCVCARRGGAVFICIHLIRPFIFRYLSVRTSETDIRMPVDTSVCRQCLQYGCQAVYHNNGGLPFFCTWIWSLLVPCYYWISWTLFPLKIPLLFAVWVCCHWPGKTWCAKCWWSFSFTIFSLCITGTF